MIRLWLHSLGGWLTDMIMSAVDETVCRWPNDTHTE